MQAAQAAQLVDVVASELGLSAKKVHTIHIWPRNRRDNLEYIEAYAGMIRRLRGRTYQLSSGAGPVLASTEALKEKRNSVHRRSSSQHLELTRSAIISSFRLWRIISSGVLVGVHEGVRERKGVAVHTSLHAARFRLATTCEPRSEARVSQPGSSFPACRLLI
jgi:hypothetical protein